MVWCVTLQLAWDELTGMCDGAVELEPPSELAEALNRRAVVGDVDDASVLVVTVRGSDAEAQLARATGDRFGGALPPPSTVAPPADAGPHDWTIYARLRKALRFDPAMNPKRHSFLGESVRGFGVETGSTPTDPEDQVVVCHDDGHHFVVELRTDDPADQLLVAMIPPGDTLAATVARAVAHRDPMPAPPQVASFWSPRIALSEEHDFTELMGSTVTSLQPEPARLAKVTQRLDFGLGHEGLSLVAEAAMAPIPTGPIPGAPRDYVLKEPFLVLLLRRGSPAPYFALWVANRDLTERCGHPVVAGCYAS